MAAAASNDPADPNAPDPNDPYGYGAPKAGARSPLQFAQDAPNTGGNFNPLTDPSTAASPFAPTNNGGDMNAYQAGTGGVDPTWNVAPTPAGGPVDVGGPHGPELAPPVEDGSGVGGTGIVSAPVPVSPSTPADPNLPLSTPTNLATAGPMGIASQLGNLINGLGQPVSDTSPGIAQPLAAERLAEQRAQEQQRQFLAERNSAEGFSDSGGADTGMLGILQDSAQRQGQYAGDLYKNADQTRVQQLLSSLGLGSSINQANNSLGFNYDALNSARNAAALEALLNGSGA